MSLLFHCDLVVFIVDIIEQIHDAQPFSIVIVMIMALVMSVVANRVLPVMTLVPVIMPRRAIVMYVDVFGI